MHTYVHVYMYCIYFRQLFLWTILVVQMKQSVKCVFRTITFERNDV